MNEVLVMFLSVLNGASTVVYSSSLTTTYDSTKKPKISAQKQASTRTIDPHKPQFFFLSIVIRHQR